MTKIVNKVALSGLITLNLEQFLPGENLVSFDFKDFLFKGLILREKEFRMAMKELDWAKFAGKNVAVFCSADAIIPVWAYMLAGVYLLPHARSVHQADMETTLNLVIKSTMENGVDPEDYRGKRVVIKGCGEKVIPASAYLEITNLLLPVAKSIMYGEPCSTVPIYKQNAG